MDYIDPKNLGGLRFKAFEGSYDHRDYQINAPLGFSNLIEKYQEIKLKEIKHGSHGNVKRAVKEAKEFFGLTYWLL